MKRTRTLDNLSLLCLALCGFLSGTGGQLAAATNTVTSLADDGPGSLRQAIAGAVAGDTINFAVTGTILLQSQLAIDKSLFIAGPGATDLTLSGQGTVRVLAISGGTVLINGLTVADGSASVAGGIDIDGAALVTITNCILRGNIASEGGGGGGAIRNWGSTLQVESCTFAGNSAVSVGGAIQNFAGTISLRNSTFSGNSASFGGALYNANYQTLSILNCTLYLNSASYSGGGISGPCEVGSSIIAGNSAALGPDCDGTINSFDFNLIQNTNGCTVTGSKSHNLLGVDPLLGPLRDNGGPTPTHALRFDSPALDKGQSNGTTTDQRGKPRIVDLPGIENAADGCDIGACEREDAIPQPEPTNKVTTLADDGPGSLRQAIVDAAPGATITFDVTGQIDLTSTELTITTNLTLSGPGPALLTISGAGARRAFNITGGDVSIAGLTIANAVNLAREPYFEAQGGAIRNAGQLTLSNTVLSGNNVGPALDGSGSGKGGAVYNSGRLTIVRCTLTWNQASLAFQTGSNENRGGAIFNTGTLFAGEATFQANRAQALGGGIYSSGALTLSNCFFFANLADAGGGGVYNETNGTLTLLESQLSTNSCLAGAGGGVDNAGKACILSSILSSNRTDMGGSGINNTSEIGVTNSTVQLNYCVHGAGGGLANSGSMAVEGCLIADNWVSVQGSLGGGIGNSGTLSVNHTTVISNTAPLGGGIGNQGAFAFLTVDNSTLAANFAMSFGGGLYTWSSGTDTPTDRVVATLRNTTISGNIAQKKRTAGGVDATTYAGNVIVNLSHCTIVSNTGTANTFPAAGGIYSGKLGTSGSATVNLYSTVLADNLTPYLPGAGQVLRDSGGSIVSQGFNLCSDGSANLTQPTDQPMTEPLVGPLADNGGPTFTHALLLGSPAINKAASGGLITDQRGQPRPFQFPGILNAEGGDGSDIGAFEAVNYQPPRITQQPQSQTVDPGSHVTFTVTASGTEPLSYQWRFNNKPLDGATSSSLELTNVTGANAGSYTVSISNVLGTVTSDNATLTVVLAPPGIAAPFIAENGQFQFRLTGTVGGSYVVLASTNLTAWTPIATNVVPAAGFNYVTDPFATNYTQRVYRAVSE